MKVYELMNLLGKVEADKEVNVHVCLTLDELTSGKQLDKTCFCLSLVVYDFDTEQGSISAAV